MIDGEPDLEVCATAAGQRSGFEAIASCRPDLVIVDLRLGRDDGLSLVRDARAGDEDLPVLVLSMHTASVWAERAFEAGANGYVSKLEAGEAVLIAIRRVLEGGEYVSPESGTGLERE